MKTCQDVPIRVCAQRRDHRVVVAGETQFLQDIGARTAEQAGEKLDGRTCLDEREAFQVLEVVDGQCDVMPKVELVTPVFVQIEIAGEAATSNHEVAHHSFHMAKGASATELGSHEVVVDAAKGKDLDQAW